MDSELFEDAQSKIEKSSVYEEPMNIDDFETNHVSSPKEKEITKVRGGNKITSFEGEPQRDTCCPYPNTCVIF